MLIYVCFFRQLGISVCKPQKSQRIRIEKLDKRKKDPEYIEPSLMFVCEQENTTAHAYKELGEISPYYQKRQTSMRKKNPDKFYAFKYHIYFYCKSQIHQV